MFINRGMDKEDVAHIYSGIFLSHKKEWNNVIFNNMDGPRDCHTEWNVRPRKPSTWNVKYDTNELSNKTETDLENKLMVTKGPSGGGIN